MAAPMHKQQDDVRVSKELNFMRSVNLDTLSKEKSMSDMLMDYFVITSGGHFRENMDKSLGKKYLNFERIFGYYDRI